MRRLLTPGVLAPLILAVVGIGLIIAGQLDLDARPGASLPDIPAPSRTEIAATATPAPTDEPSESQLPTISPTPEPLTSLATQLQIEAVGINVPVHQSTSDDIDAFPPECCAFILQQSSQPGRGTNSYIFAHAVNDLFKPLWNVQVGDAVLVQMDDGAVLDYVVTEVRPNVPCPDENAPNPELNPEALGVELPLVLQYAPDDCGEGTRWTQPTDHERLTLQTSQGYNRNWGELVVIAEPAP
ncbi:MAG: sortase [Chloroflexota bacterium]